MKNESWNWRTIGELFEIGAGKTMSEAARNGVNKIPFLRTSNVLWDEIDLTQVDEMSMSPDELKVKSLSVGDLLVCEGGEIGRAAVWNGQIPIVSFQNHLHRLRPLLSDIDPRFYVYFLQSAFTQLGIFEGAGNKTTIPNLSRSRLAALDVPHPPLDEQRDIARALRQVRTAMETHNQATEKAQELKRAAMRELFTRGLRGEPQKETEIGLVPESWEETTLGKLCEASDGHIQTGPFGSQLHSYEYVLEGIPVVNPTHLESNRINHENVPKVSPETAERLGRHKLEPGDILFGRRGEIGRHGLVSKAESNWLCGTGCFVVRVRERKAENTFLSYLFSTERSVSWLVSNATGTIMPNLNNLVLSRLPVVLPQIAEQSEIVTILDAIDHKIDLHRKKRAILEELFKSLLHKLMTGEIRVGDLDLSALNEEPRA